MNLNLDKETLRRYLLGTLEVDPRAELEETILRDPAVYEELLLLEEELIEEYVAGDLPKIERQQFETHFLVTAERQKKLRFGQFLKRYLSSHAHSENVAIQELNHTVPPRRFYAPFALVVVVAAVLVIGLLCWLAVRKPVEQPAAVQQDSSRLVVVVALAPGKVDSHGVTIPPQGVDVKLELEVSNASFKNYKSELFRENKPLQIDALRVETKGEQHIVPLTITGQTLSPGDYQVKLSGVSDSGQDEFIDNYSFRVTK